MVLSPLARKNIFDDSKLQTCQFLSHCPARQHKVRKKINNSLHHGALGVKLCFVEMSHVLTYPTNFLIMQPMATRTH